VSPKRRERIREAYEIIRELLPCAVISIKESPGIPGVSNPHQYIEVDP